MPRQSKYGVPLQYPSASAYSEVAFELGGIDQSQPITDIPLGRAFGASNLMTVNGGLQQRPALWGFPFSSTTPSLSAPMATQVLGGVEIVNTVGVPSQIASGTTNWAWYSNGSWSRLSYVTAGGVSDPPSLSTVSYWDLIQTYDPVSDDMIAVGAPGSYQSLYCWKSGSTLFSTLTSAPRAKYVASYDNYLVALNVRDPASATSLYVQRVQWSDRGNPSNWTAGLSGFEDLLDMKGQGTRIISDGRRMVIFSDLEIWQGVTANAPFQFVFSAIDRSVGCPYPWSVCQTPAGIVFLGTGSRPYLLPTDGGELQPIGDSVRPYIQSFVNFGVSTDRIWSVYDPYFNTWRLFLHASGQDYPGGGLLYDMGTQEWFTQQYTSYLDAAGANPTAKSFYLTRGWIGRGDTNSSGTVWSASGFSGSYTWDNVPGLWQQMAPATAYGPRTVFMGTSTGTIMRERPDAGVYPADIMDSSLNTIYASWTGRAVAGEHAEGGKAISRVAVVFGAGSATSMRIALGASRQTLALPSTSARGQRSTSFHYIARDPRINLFANPWRVPISRLIVTYREGDDGVYSDADF